MVRTFIYSIVACFLLSFSAKAAFPPAFNIGGSGKNFRSNYIYVPASSGDACSGCTNETYEGTGTVVAGWVYGGGGGVTNVNYTTSPAPLADAQSFLLMNPAFGDAYAYLNVPASSEIWMRWMMICTNTIVNGLRVAFVGDAGFAQQASVEIRSSGLRVVCGGNATTVSTLTAGTLYYCWFHYKKGTGANAVADIAFSTTKTRPTSGNGFAQLTNGTSTGNAVQPSLYVGDVDFSGAVGGIIYDNFSISVTGQIGDFP